MIYSTDRILTAHAGSLPRPDDLREMVLAKARGEPINQSALDARLRSAVAEIVERQVACGLDVINDGELSKPNFTDYVSARIAGCENRPGTGFRRLSMTARDETKFAEYFAAHPRPRYSGGATMPVCVDELRYVGQAELARDLDNFKAALTGVTVAEAFLPANTPGTIEHWMENEHYDSDEAFLFAIAEAIAAAAGSGGLPAQTADSVLAAIRDIPVHDGNGRVLICGSLYFAGKVLAENG